MPRVRACMLPLRILGLLLLQAALPALVTSQAVPYNAGSIAAARGATPLAPDSPGCFFGTAIAWAAWDFDLGAYSRALGFVPASWVVSVDLPLPRRDREVLQSVLPQIAALDGIAVITVRPMGGLGPGSYKDDDVRALAALIRRHEQQGLRAILRFAEQPNGSWFPWGMQPAAYKAAFRRFAGVVRNETLGASMMWAVADGGGYPAAGARADAGGRACNAQSSCERWRRPADVPLPPASVSTCALWPGPCSAQAGRTASRTAAPATSARRRCRTAGSWTPTGTAC